MWSSVGTAGGGGAVPGARHKHALCTHHPHVYLLGGRHGNLPLKDFWTYDLVSRSWTEVRGDEGPRPPPLQQHTMVRAGNRLLVFGGELCMSNETPLWSFDIQNKKWRKVAGACSSGRAVGGGRLRAAATPSGRRGHTAVMLGDDMLVYGGYQDLRGSCAELWAFNTKEERWRQLPVRGEQPPPRHAHSALIHDCRMWVYGGMTDLQERSDFWYYDTGGATWTQVRARPSPGQLHSHVAAQLHGSMVVFGGERQGEILNELWRYQFSVGTWERLVSSGIRPQPRSQFCAFVAPSHHVKGSRLLSAPTSSPCSGGGGGGGGVGHDSYRTRRVHPDDSIGGGGGEGQWGARGNGAEEEMDEAEDGGPGRWRGGGGVSAPPASTALRLSISKLSQLNLAHLGRYYSYSMLSNESSESLADRSLATTCDSLASRITKSRSTNFTAGDDPGSPTAALPRDILSVPDFGPLAAPAHNAVKVVTVVPVEGGGEASLEDDAGDLVADIKGRLAFSPDDPHPSADTSISDNLMSFSCTTDSSVSSPAGPLLPAPHTSFSNPNYVGYGGGGGGGLLSQDYWRAGALDLESLRHREFADLLRTPPDSGIGLGVEMERRTPLDVTMATLEDFVTLDSSAARFCKTHGGRDGDGGGGDPPNRAAPPSTTRVTFLTVQPGEGGPGAPREPPPPRINPFLREDGRVEPRAPSAMYVMGGKEADHMTAFKRPISVWKLDLPF